MNKYNGLLSSIAQELQIHQGLHEDENTFKCRVLYSILGRMAYASLWDTAEDTQSVTIVHLKQRISCLLEGYFKLYPELKPLFSDDASALGDEVYQLYLATGCLYHSPNRILPCTPCQSISTDVTLCRGLPLNQTIQMSGIGVYQTHPNLVFRQKTIAEMFQLPTSLLEPWEQALSSASWHEMQDIYQREFLSLTPPFRGGYWCNAPIKDGSVSLMRTGTNGQHFYYLYRFEDKKLFCSQLPAWKVDKGNYRALSHGLLSSLGKLPPTTYQTDGDIVHLHFHYLPPPPELNLIKLYSWSRSFFDFHPSGNQFHRIMSTNVFFTLKTTLEQIGYQFTEE